MPITGEQGRLIWGYDKPGDEAAILHPWTLTKIEGAWALSGTIARVDSFRVSQQPLKFVTPNGWRWPVTQLQIMGASLQATLGPKE